MTNVVTIKYPLLHVIYYITLPNILDDMRKKWLYEKKMIVILPVFFQVILYTRDNTRLITSSVNSYSRVVTYVTVKQYKKTEFIYNNEMKVQNACIAHDSYHSPSFR